MTMSSYRLVKQLRQKLLSYYFHWPVSDFWHLDLAVLKKIKSESYLLYCFFLKMVLFHVILG